MGLWWDGYLWGMLSMAGWLAVAVVIANVIRKLCSDEPMTGTDEELFYRGRHR